MSILPSTTTAPNAQKHVSRRQCLASAVAAVAYGIIPRQAFSVDRFVRPVPGQLRLSLAAYSLRQLLNKPQGGMDLFQFVDYCHAQQIPGAELTSYYFPKEVTNDYLVELKQHCHKRGVTISGGAIRNDFCQNDEAKVREDIEHTRKWIDHYAVLGAPVIRIFAGKQPKTDSWETTIARCVSACETAAKYAASKGIYLALENHGGVTEKAEGLLEIVRRIQSNALGINFDSGNFHSTSDPYLELQQIAPYSVNAQIKVEMTIDGKKQDTDIPRVVSILKQAGYSGWVALEYEEAEDPLAAIPKWISKIRAAI